MVQITDVRPSTKNPAKTVIEFSQKLNSVQEALGVRPLTYYATQDTAKINAEALAIGTVFHDCTIKLVDLPESDWREYIDKEGNPAIQKKQTILV